MARSVPPLTWTRAFEAAARHLNFTAAAGELGLTQSAISQQVRALESRLGVQLFVRKPRGLALTDDARKLLPQVATALDMLSAAAQMFDTGSQSGLLTVAASVSVAQWIIAPRLDAYLARYPDQRVRLISTIWPDDFQSMIADVEIRFGSEKQAGPSAQRLTPDSLITVSAPDATIPLAERPLIEVVGMSEGWRTFAAATQSEASFEPAIFVDSHGMALELAVQGAGVALTSSYLAKPLLAAGRLVQAHPAAIASSEGYYLTADPASEAARDFQAFFFAQL